jgi:predicted membrane protein (TIGR00267 family)
MKLAKWFDSPRTRLDITAGMVDGILTALTLAAGLLGHGGATLGLALRVGLATALTTLFVFFVAHYAELRTELAHAERELNLTAHGKLAAGRLGRRSLEDAFLGALTASLCGLLGALLPLLLCYFLPGPAMLGIGITLGLLGVLGALLARSFRGRPLPWAVGITLGGLALTWLGMWLHIAG